MPKLQQPYKAFDTSFSTYKETTTIVNIMKSGGSPYPYDHTSVILKRFPILNDSTSNISLLIKIHDLSEITVIHQIISHC